MLQLYYRHITYYYSVLKQHIFYLSVLQNYKKPCNLCLNKTASYLYSGLASKLENTLWNIRNKVRIIQAFLLVIKTSVTEISALKTVLLFPLTVVLRSLIDSAFSYFMTN